MVPETITLRCLLCEGYTEMALSLYREDTVMYGCETCGRSTPHVRSLLPTEEPMDWEKAKAHLDEIEEAYKSLIGMPQANPFFGLASIAGLKAQYVAGERSRILYDGIMGME